MFWIWHKTASNVRLQSQSFCQTKPNMSKYNFSSWIDWMKPINYKGNSKSFQIFFVWALLLIVHTWNSSPLRSNLLRLQCTCYTVPKNSGRPHGSPLVWACQWPSSQPLSSSQLFHKGSLWALGITKSYKEQGLDYREGEEMSGSSSWSNSLWQG